MSVGSWVKAGLFGLGLAAASMAVGPAAADAGDIAIGVIMRKIPPPPADAIDPVPADEGVAGARIAIEDNNTTGRFMKQHYALSETVLDKDQSPVDAAKALVAKGTKILVLSLPAPDVTAVADAVKDSGAIVFNAGATDDSLRNADCRANVFSVAPSRAMLTDALMQYLATKRWTNLFLVTGPTPADGLYADQVRRAAKKFGLKIGSEKAWTFGALATARADGPLSADALVFTRDVDYDVLIVADEPGDFGDYVLYRTWSPKLVAGTQGLIATTMHPTLQVWGATQLQNRFQRTFQRRMRPVDYQVWMAVRAVGEAATRARTGDPAALAAFMVKPEFQLAAYKGVPTSFRPWDHQLRQPILVVQPMSLVSVSPQPEFLHQRSPLDSLGTDEPESTCKFH